MDTFFWFLVNAFTVLAGIVAIWRPADVVAMKRKYGVPLPNNLDEAVKRLGLVRLSGVLAIVFGLGIMGLRFWVF